MKNFYLLYGNDKTIIENELNELLKKLKDTDIIKYSLDNTSIEEIIEDASTISMFANKKIIILDNCNFFSANKAIEKQELLENYLNNNNPNTYIIFIANTEKVDTRKKIYKALNKSGQIIECQKSESYTTNYTINYIKENGYQIEDINNFINTVENNLDNIKNELDKLFMYKKENKTITNEDIDKICIKNIEEEIFALTDAIIEKNKTKSLKLLYNFLNKTYDEIAIINLIASQFRFLFQVKRLENKNKTYDEIGKILEVNPYRVKFTLKKLVNYTERDLTSRIKELAKIDHDIKLGLIDKKIALELFILNS